jgi:hypothetical protein
LALLALLPLGRALARVALLLRDDFAFKLLLAVNCFAFLIFEKRCKNLPKKTLRIFFILTFHPPTSGRRPVFDLFLPRDKVAFLKLKLKVFSSLNIRSHLSA